MRRPRASFKFQSAPPVREATQIVGSVAFPLVFQSAPPVREATTESLRVAAEIKFQSAPPVREATVLPKPAVKVGTVSIRAPR